MNNISAERSREDYLETILSLIKKNGACRATDIADSLGYSKASVSIALKKLEDSGLVIRDDWRILLTDKGREIASGTLEKHNFFKSLFISCGIDPDTAEKEACLVEHAVSESSFQALRARLGGIAEGDR
ncbi:MAG: metal-dependent transcriptional regulator [Firmicutes bacterium]|nr:metal-dependent transcriptional regulator [Bacillota bacterium]